MLCRNPWMQGLHAYPCGRCDPCLRKRRRIWTHRILLEASLREDNCFVTLTYAPEWMPALGSLQKSDYQNFLKRLRKSVAPLKLRYFVVGEYGDEGGRPHYHMALFGFPSCRNGRTRRTTSNKPDPERCCVVCRSISRTWQRGIVDLGSIDIGSAKYISGYVTKKMTHRHHPWLQGRDPEFARMSLKPGLGLDMMHELASTLMQFNIEDRAQGDVPVTLRSLGQELPLGRYLRRKLRLMVGKEEGAPQIVTQLQEQEMRDLYEAKIRTGVYVSLKEAVVHADDGTVASQDARVKILKQRKSL